MKSINANLHILYRLIGNNDSLITENHRTTISPLWNDFGLSYFVLLTQIAYILLGNINYTEFHAILTEDVELHLLG